MTGTVTIDGDALAVDDAFNFTLPDEDELVILLVVPDDAASDETLYFERAVVLGKAPVVRVERRRPGTVDAKSLEKASLVVLWDTPAMGGSPGTASPVNRLLRFLCGS